MRGSPLSWLIATAMTIAAQAGASEVCLTETPQPNVRRHLEKQAAQLLAPDAIDRKSLWFCGYGGLTAQAIIESVPRRLPDGSDLVLQASCDRIDKGSRTRWTCRRGEFRQTDMLLTLGGAPWRFKVILAPEANPEFARRLVDRAMELSSQVSAQNYCAHELPRYALETFNSSFIAKPLTTENPTLFVGLVEGVWQVSRQLSGMTFEIPESGVPQLKCWKTWDEL